MTDSQRAEFFAAFKETFGWLRDKMNSTDKIRIIDSLYRRFETNELFSDPIAYSIVETHQTVVLPP